MQRNAVENFDAMAAFNNKSFNAIETVQFGLTAGQSGEIPARRGRLASNTSARVQRAATLKDASNRSLRWRMRDAAPSQFPFDRRLSILSQRAGLSHLV